MLLCSTNSYAATKYIGTTANCSAGNGDGNSVANCLKNMSTEATLRTQLETANDYRVLPGTYTFTSSAASISGSTSIKGWKTDDTEQTDATQTIFTGTSATYDTSDGDLTTAYGFKALDDADNITLENFSIRMFRYNLDFAGKSSADGAPTTAKHTGIVIDNVISEITDQALNIAGDKLTNQGIKTIDSMSAANDTITTSGNTWSFAENDPVAIQASTMPTGLSKFTTYYVKNYSAGVFKLSATAGGAAIDISGSVSNGLALYAPVTGNSTITVTNSIFRNYSRSGIRSFHRVASFTGTNNKFYGTDKDAWTNGTVTTSDTTSPYTGDIVTSTGHGLATTQPIIVKATTMPGGVTERTELYWPVSITTDTFCIALTQGGAAINLTGTPVSFQWNKCYNTTSDQTGMQFGVSSGGARETAEWNIALTNFYASDHNNRTNPGARQGDGLVNEITTQGTLVTTVGSAMSYSEYAADAGFDSKGSWIIGTLGTTGTGMVSRRNLFAFKSYGDNGVKLTVNHSLGITNQCNGGTQCGDPRILQLFGDMDCNFSTFYNHSSDSFKIAKLQTSNPTPILNLTDCLIGYFNAYSGTFASKYSIVAGGTVNEVRTYFYEDEAPATGTDPQFVDITDTDFDGTGDSWNPQLAAYADGAAGWYSAVGGGSPGTLTATNVQPASLEASAAGNVVVSFTLAQALPATAKVKIHFPTSLGSGFTFNSGGTTAASSITGMDGTLSASVASNVITLTRSGATQTALGTACSFTLSNIQNPSAAGTTGVYKIYTTTSADVAIDQDEAVTADTITNPPSGGTGLTTFSGTINFSGTVQIN